MAYMTRILCVNHRDRACGVHQFFRRLTEPLLKSAKYDVYYIDPAQEFDFNHWYAQLAPDIVLFNFYTSATMSWLTLDKVRSLQCKTTCLFHEVPIDYMGFDHIFHQDPDAEERYGYTNLARPIPVFPRHTASTASNRTDARPIISSFGFGLGGKGFDRVVSRVCAEFDSALIRLNIPYAKFGDESGNGARSWAIHARQAITKPGIELQVTHEFMDEDRLLEWLAQSDINCFFYDENYGRGISGTTDYALAVGKPISITKSWQFKHLWLRDESLLLDNTSLVDSLARGVDHLEKFHEIWNDTAVVQSFEKGFERVLQ